MDEETRQTLLKKLHHLYSRQPVVVKQNGVPVSTILPVKDWRTFDLEQTRRLDALKTELRDLLTLIRVRVGGQTLGEIEARLAEHRRAIEEEQKNIDRPGKHPPTS